MLHLTHLLIAVLTAPYLMVGAHVQAVQRDERGLITGELGQLVSWAT